VFEYDRELSIKRRPWTTRGCCAMGRGRKGGTEQGKQKCQIINRPQAPKSWAGLDNNRTNLHCIKLHNTLALPVLLYGSETWTVKARDGRRITAAEMKYMRRTAGCTWTDYKTNAQIAKELKITSILDKLLEYKRSWIQHVNRMPRNRLPRIMKHYCPTGRRNHGRPVKRLLDT